MAIFAVIGIGDPSPLESAIKQQYPDDHYLIDPGKWLISADAVIARQIAENLGMEEKRNIQGIVLTFSGYFGYAPSEVWEWIKVKGVKVASIR